MPPITIYCVAYNEEVFLQYMIDFYKNRFTDCHIIIYDNESTDNTVKIALANNCEIRLHNTNNQHDDVKLTQLKNNCWKQSKTDWNIVCDIDELLNISSEQLKLEEISGTSIIRSEGWNMVNLENNYDFTNIKYGTRVSQYDKSYLFNRRFISEINYVCGAHTADPVGTIKYSNDVYKLYHYHCINPDYLVARYQWTAKRLSQNNKKTGMGSYNLRTEAEIRAGYANGANEARKNRVIL